MISFRGDLSLSKAPLLHARESPDDPKPTCSWWMLPGSAWRAETNEFSEGGTAVHAPLAALVNGGELVIPTKPNLRALYAAGREWLLDHDIPGTVTAYAERVFAYDVATDTGRELADPPGEEGTRWYVDAAKRVKYGVRPTEICTRVDLAIRVTDERGVLAWVIDFKCHFQPEAASAAAQLEDGSLAVSRAWKVDRARATGVHLWEDRDTVEEEFTLDVHALGRVAERLARDLEVAEDTQPVPGPHCDALHCPAKASCPVTLKAVESRVELIPAERLSREYSAIAPATTNDHLAWKVTLIPLLEAFVAAMKDEVKAGADALDGVTLKDGGVYSGKTHIESNPDLTVPGAVEALEELGLDLAIDTTPKTTWKAIQAAAGGEAGKDLAKAALAKVGAVKESPVTVYRARGPEKAGAKALRAKTRAKAVAS